MPGDTLATLWTDWDPLADIEAPLRQQQPTLYRVATDIFRLQAEELRTNLRAETFGVMAVAGAAGPFHREEDGYTVKGSWTASDGREVPLRWPNMLSGPHTFMAETAHPAEARRIMAGTNTGSSFQQEASRAAYRWANDRINAGGLADNIVSGALWPLPNVWLGASASTWDDILLAGHLERVPAATRVLHLKPTEELCLRETFGLYEPEDGVFQTKVGSRWAGSPDWVIVSAPEGGSLDTRWVETIIAQCRGAEVPVWVDSLGPKPFTSPEHDGGTGFFLAIQHPTGSDMSEWPENLRVRQMPEVRHA